jgi:hypothetical protein
VAARAFSSARDTAPKWRGVRFQPSNMGEGGTAVPNRREVIGDTLESLKIDSITLTLVFVGMNGSTARRVSSGICWIASATYHKRQRSRAAAPVRPATMCPLQYLMDVRLHLIQDIFLASDLPDKGCDGSGGACQRCRGIGLGTQLYAVRAQHTTTYISSLQYQLERRLCTGRRRSCCSCTQGPSLQYRRRLDSTERAWNPAANTPSSTPKVGPAALHAQEQQQHSPALLLSIEHAPRAAVLCSELVHFQTASGESS